jgi:hypothetical protein
MPRGKLLGEIDGIDDVALSVFDCKRPSHERMSVAMRQDLGGVLDSVQFDLNSQFDRL